MDTLGKIALIGSGELTPSMVEVHKHLLHGVGSDKAAYFLDTPAGFQPNADDISKKAQDYFLQHVQSRLSIAECKSIDSLSQYDMHVLAKRLENAGYLLVGPGSPTYMLRHLQGTTILQSIAQIVRKGGCLAIASAAALTAGLHTLPVYEIYKVGSDLHWQKGLNILDEFHIPAVVIPHWDNGEGGTHDTRFCYMGEERFTRLREMLPGDTLYIGIDEHTACILDLQQDKAEVRGQGGVTLLQSEQSRVFAKGEQFSLQLIREGLKTEKVSVPEEKIKAAVELHKEEEKSSFWQTVHSITNTFNSSIAKKDYRQCSHALLEFDSHILQAVAHFESTENLSQAREIFRDLIVLLGIELQGYSNDLDNYLQPLMENLLTLRSVYKKQKKWQEADAIRDVFTQANIHIEDTPQGTRFSYHDDMAKQQEKPKDG